MKQIFSSYPGQGVTPAAYVVPVVALVMVLVVMGIILIVLMRTRKRKRVRGHISQLQSPGPTSPDAPFYKKRLESGQFSPMSVLSPQATNVVFNDPLEFPRNQLLVYTKKVLGKCKLFTAQHLLCTIVAMTSYPCQSADFLYYTDSTGCAYTCI